MSTDQKEGRENSEAAGNKPEGHQARKPWGAILLVLFSVFIEIFPGKVLQG